MFEHLRYESSLITFTEIPDEISLCLNITGCPCMCQDCFEPWLAEDTGTILDYAVLKALLDSHPHISCLCFMGGDRYYEDIIVLYMELKNLYPKLKWAIYSGRNQVHPWIWAHFDYIKVGPYIPKYGPLNKPTTNQVMWKRIDGQLVDITYRFQEKKV